jgi:hypothetical protein
LKISELAVENIRKLAKTYNYPIFTNLHQNPGSNKERGHLGSELLQKAENVMEIQRDGSISKLVGKSFRNCGEIPEVHFEYNSDKGYHTLVDIITPESRREAKEQAKEAKSEKQVSALREEFSKLFNGKPIRMMDLCRAYETMTGCSIATAKRRVADAKELGILNVDTTGLYILS